MQNISSCIGWDALKLSLVKVLSVFMGLVSAMLLSRFCTLEEYGTYSQLFIITNLSTAIFMLGLPNSINYFLARAEETSEKQKFLSVYYTLSTALCIAMGFVLVLLIPVLQSFFKNRLLCLFFYFLAVYPWASVISSSIENVLIVYKKASFLVLYRLLYSFCILSITAVSWYLKVSFNFYVVSFLLVNVIFALSVYVISANLCGGLSVAFDKELIQKIFKFSLPLGLGVVIGTIDLELDKLLIGWLMNTEQLAIYTNAAKELPLTIIAASITAVLLPRIALLLKHDEKEKAVMLWGYSIELSLLFTAFFVFAIFTFAEDVMTFLYSAKYLQGVQVFRVYTLVILLRVTYFGIILNANGATKKIMYCSVAALVLNVILNPLFFWLFGMIGPAIATFVSLLLISLLQLYLTSTNIAVHFRYIFPWRKILLILIINLIFSGLFYVIKHILSFDMLINSIIESLILGIVWAGVYFFVVKKLIVRLWNNLNNC